MLFDLQGRRRRVVQATYLMLAVLMGGGLVLFGIGGDVSGGLFDAFSDRRAGGAGDSQIRDRVEKTQTRLRANPRDEAALKSLVRDYYNLATQETAPGATAIGAEGRDELARAAAAWQRYVALEPKRPDDSLAQLAMNIYSEFGLNQPERAADVAEIVADARPSANAYLQLTTYAALAGQTRKAELAGRKAIHLAPKSQRSNVEKQVEQAKAAPAIKQLQQQAQQQQQGGGGGSPIP